MARKPNDLSNQVICGVEIKKYAGKVGKYPSWWCECTCGKRFTAPAYELRRGVARCPFCQTHTDAMPLCIEDQIISILPARVHRKLSAEYIGGLVKRMYLENNSNALLIMLDDVPAESLQNLGSDLEGDMDEADSADSAAEEWENNATHFDKPLDK